MTTTLRTPRRAALVGVLLLASTGCAGATDGDQAACDKVVGAHNSVVTQAKAAKNVVNADKDQAVGAIIDEWDAMPAAVEDALSVADDVTVRLELAALSRELDKTEIFHDLTALDAQFAAVEKACQAAGVDVELYQ